MSTPKRVTRPIRENPQATTVVATGVIAAVVGAFADKYAPGLDVETRALIVGAVSVPALAVIGWLAQRFTLPAAAVDLVLTPEQRAAMFPLLRATESGGERPAQPFPGPLPHHSVDSSVAAQSLANRLNAPEWEAPPGGWRGGPPEPPDPWMDTMRAPVGEPQDTLPPTPYPVEAEPQPRPYDHRIDYGSATINAPTAAETTGNRPLA